MAIRERDQLVTDQPDDDSPKPAEPPTDPAPDPPDTDAPDDGGADDGAPDDGGGEQPGIFGPSDGDESEEPADTRGFFRRHKAVTILCSLGLVLLLAVGGWAAYLNYLLGDIDRIDPFSSIDDRPDPAEGEALNILLAGADNGDSEGPSIEDAMADGEWSAGTYRSDTIMVLHIPEDHSRAYLVSIPRDSYVRIYDETGDFTEKHKINYAFSVYGPSGYVSTLEHLTDIRMDHLAIIDWAGFKDVVDALGGVRLYVAETVRDTSQNYTYEKGWDDYNGEEALRYVRSRYGLDEGDFDRSRRQQNFLRAMLDELASTGTLTNQLKFASVFKAITSNLTVDEDWSGGDMRGLAWAMRGIRKDDVTFLSAPLRADMFGDVEGEGSVVYLDKRGLDELFTAMREDDMQSYVNDHPELELPSETQVD